MCEIKPWPRCFSHYEPRYRAAKKKYRDALKKTEKKAKEGPLTDEDRQNLTDAFENYQAAQRMFYMSPKARREVHESETKIVHDKLEEAKKLYDENPEDEYNRLRYEQIEADYKQIKVQDVEGARRWEDAKRAGMLSQKLNHNGLERGLFSEAQYTDEDLAEVNIDSWDRACPDGNVVLHGIDDKLQQVNKRGIYRQATVTSEKRLELPTGERVDFDLMGHINQPTKNVSNYYVTFEVDDDEEKGLGTFIPNSTAHDGFYSVGAPAEMRPVTRDNSPSARDGGTMRSSDWEHTQGANKLTDKELAEQQERFANLQEEVKADNEAHGRGMYTRVNTFAKSLNKTKKGERYNALTKRLVEEHGLKTSFNNIKDARAEVARILTLQNVVLTESVKDSREKSINDYGAQQFGATTQRERDREEKKARTDIEELPERLKPQSRREIRDHGGGPDRVERATARLERRHEVIQQNKKIDTAREKSIDSGNDYLEHRRKDTGHLNYSTHIDSTRRHNTGSKAGYSYKLANMTRGGRQQWGKIEFTKGGKLAQGYTKSDAKDPKMIDITTPKGQTFSILRSQFDAMSKTGKKI